MCGNSICVQFPQAEWEKLALDENKSIPELIALIPDKKRRLFVERKYNGVLSFLGFLAEQLGIGDRRDQIEDEMIIAFPLSIPALERSQPRYVQSE